MSSLFQIFCYQSFYFRYLLPQGLHCHKHIYLYVNIQKSSEIYISMFFIYLFCSIFVFYDLVFSQNCSWYLIKIFQRPVLKLTAGSTNYNIDFPKYDWCSPTAKPGFESGFPKCQPVQGFLFTSVTQFHSFFNIQNGLWKFL